MADYGVTKLDQSEDAFTHFVLFPDCDPLTFDEAVQYSKYGGRKLC